MPLKRPDSSEYAPYYETYVGLVPEGDVVQLLTRQFEDSSILLSPLTDEQAAFRYAPEKWSIKELVGHLNDTERIFAARALHFARGAQASLPGYEQDEYVAVAASDDVPIADLLAEYYAVRQATITLFGNLPRDAWDRRGTADGVGFTVRSVANIIAGHELHHQRVLQERYLF